MCHLGRCPARWTKPALVVASLVAAAAACGTVDVGDTPADVASCRPSKQFFVDQIWPNFLAKEYKGKHCYDSGCHDASGRRGGLILVPPASPTGVPLSPEWEAMYKGVTENVLCTNVSSSRLLTKTDGRQMHGGLQLIDPAGDEETLVKMWVTIK